MCYLLGVVKQSGENLRWDTIAYFSCIPTGLHLLLVWLVPESPAVHRQETIGVSESLWQGRFLRPMLVSLGLMFFQQFGGTSAFLANLQNILRDSGSALTPAVACLLVGLAGALASFLGSPLIGFFGPKMMWNISSAAQAVALTLAALQEKYAWNGLIPMICLFLDNFCFGVGTAPIPWFFVPELFPDSVRAFAASIITACCWIMGTLLFFIWDAMKAGIGQVGGFAVFAALMALSLVFGITCLPDLKSAEEDEASPRTNVSAGLLQENQDAQVLS
jgi:MFS family permease